MSEELEGFHEMLPSGYIMATTIMNTQQLWLLYKNHVCTCMHTHIYTRVHMQDVNVEGRVVGKKKEFSRNGTEKTSKYKINKYKIIFKS